MDVLSIVHVLGGKAQVANEAILESLQALTGRSWFSANELEHVVYLTGRVGVLCSCGEAFDLAQPYGLLVLREHLKVDHDFATGQVLCELTT